MAQSVSKRKCNFLNETKIENLKQITLKKKTELKVNWVVTAYNEWGAECLEKFNYDYPIYNADLMDLANLTKENLQHALCRFIHGTKAVKSNYL